MPCSRCGAASEPGDAFCPRCGARLAPEPTTVLPAAPPPGAPPGPWPAPPPGPPSPPPGAGRRRGLLVAAGVLGVLAVAGGAVAGTLALTGDDEQPRASASPSPTPTPTPSPEPTDFSDLYRDVASGVVRLDATSCEGTGTGTGFLLEPDLVATVAHVVAGTETVLVSTEDEEVEGTVVGIDPSLELALVRTDEPLDGHVFALARREPDVGEEVAAIGYPLAGPQSFTRGSVSGLDRSLELDGASLEGLVQTDAAINPGNSGGPLLTLDGDVVGLVDAKRVDAESIAFAIPSTTAREVFADWDGATAAQVDVGSCEGPYGDEEAAVEVTDETGTEAGAFAAETLAAYAIGITTGDYDTAYARLSPALQADLTREEFEDGTRTSFFEDVRVLEAEGSGDTLTVLATFRTYQDPADSDEGQECSDWTMAYTMVPGDDGLLIDGADPQDGSPTAC